MSIYEYIRFDITKRADILWEKGAFLETYIDKENSVKIYYLNNFFVEVIISTS